MAEQRKEEWGEGEEERQKMEGGGAGEEGKAKAIKTES